MLHYLTFGLSAASLASAATLYNGAQQVVLSASMPTSCNSAFNTTLNCPNNVLQFLTYSNLDVAWNTSTLTAMCTAPCKSSLTSLMTAVTSGCGTAAFNFNSVNMTYVDVVDLIQYKYGQVCLADASSGQFCSDVENTWNITTMVAAKKATWPTYTNKSYPDLSTGSWDPPTDVDGTLINTFTTNNFQAAANVRGGQAQAADYWTTVPPPIDDSNYGWKSSLEYDEYPLEIQCSSCWMQRFKYGYLSKWGTIWDDITQQIWTNMQMNCKINQTIVPVNDYRGKDRNNTYDSYFPSNPNPPCYQTLNITGNSTTCGAVGLQYKVPTSALQVLNHGLNCYSITNLSLCAPQSCPVAVVPSQMSFRTFWIQMNYTNITDTQFLGWNRMLSTAIMYAGDTVCVGPATGFYTPSNASPAYPTVYTTTAQHPDPTPSGTIANCGKYYKIQSGDYCNTVALNFSLTFSQLIAMNPSIDSACSNLFLGYDYCVAPVNGTNVPSPTTTLAPASTKSSSTSTKPTSSSSTTAATTTSSKSTYPTPPAPTVSGTTSQCNVWYTTVSGDTCNAIDTKYSITLTQFRAWNTFIDAACDNLYVGYAYCVSGPAVATTTTSPTAAATPTPTQTGMVANCKTFYQAVSGDSCSAIATKYSITTTQFYTWNPAVGSSCSTLFAGYYYCVSA